VRAAGVPVRVGGNPLLRPLGKFRDFDGFMLAITVVIMGFGAVAIASASGMETLGLSNQGVRQALFALVGIALCLVTASIDYRLIASASWVLYWLGIGALALVLVPGVGTDLNTGASRWFDLYLVTLQPSEFAKVTTALALAHFLSSRREALAQFGTFVLSILIVALPMALIAAEPDFDTTLTFAVIWAAMMLVSKPRRLHLALLAAATPVAAVLAYQFVLRDFHRARILAFLGLQEDALGLDFQQAQAAISVGSGGIFGNGLFGGTPSQFDLLSVRTSDFVFAHASSMFGFVGMSALLFCFVLLILRMLRVVEVARDGFGQCFAIAMAGVVTFQAFINIGMNLGMVPVAGIPLPFVSAGVSSLWAFLIAQGILQSILMHHRKIAFQPE
jgi:rod shape determining protein RodA